MEHFCVGCFCCFPFKEAADWHLFVSVVVVGLHAWLHLKIDRWRKVENSLLGGGISLFMLNHHQLKLCGDSNLEALPLQSDATCKNGKQGFVIAAVFL